MIKENKKVTLDGLATLMSKGFDRLDKKIDGKINELEKKIDGKFEASEKKIEGKLFALEGRMDKKMDSKLDALENRIDGKIEKLAIAVKKGFDETATKSEMAELKLELTGKMTKVEEKVDHVEYLLNNHDRRLDLVEDKARVIGVKVGIS